LIGWRRPNTNAAARLLVFHGNAGYALHRDYYADAFGSLDAGRRWEVLLFEYPGYGARPGPLGRKAFVAAGTAAVDELLAADSRPLYLLGESIGSGPVCEIAAARPDRIAGVVLVVPFARLVDVARAHFPFLPVGLLLRDKFDNPAALKTYRGPVAVVVAEQDEIVGAAQGRALHEAIRPPKLLIELPGAGHNRFPTEPDAAWFREVSEFLRRP
jgi:pimeloyl-ACP methyl ester carboxylesterase